MGEIVAPAPRIAARLDPSSARWATADELLHSLATAPTEYLQNALDNPHLDASHLSGLLRNPNASGAVLENIVAQPRFSRRPEVRRALVLHRRTPLPVAVGLLAELPWLDLAELSKTPAIHPELRRRADRQILARLPAMAVGERISLARLATERIVEKLAGDPTAEVGRAVAGNPRLTEVLLLRLLGQSEVAPGFLAAIASHPRWGARIAIGEAVVRHPRTPISAALTITRRIGPTDLRRIVNDVKVPKIVRIAAERRIESHGSTRPSDLFASDLFASDQFDDARVPGPDGSRD
jgi:hypothetical protein